MNRLIRFTRYAISIGIFFFMLSNTISVEILPKSVHSQRMYDFFEGVASAKFGSEVSELTVDKEFISSYGDNGKNSYYVLNFTPRVLQDVEFYRTKYMQDITLENYKPSNIFIMTNSLMTKYLRLLVSRQGKEELK